MKVFISWSGDLSRAIAGELSTWLSSVVQAVEPWMSDEAIGSGKRWRDEVGAALNDTHIGIICVTRDNQHRPWLMFESGALAKHLKSASVIPLCIDLEPAEIDGPLSDWQARKLDYAGIKRIISDINAASDRPLTDQVLTKILERMWPDFKVAVDEAKRSSPLCTPPPRPERDMLGEILDRVRRLEAQEDSGLRRFNIGDSVTVNRQTFMAHDKEDAEAIAKLIVHLNALRESAIVPRSERASPTDDHPMTSVDTQ